MTRLASGNSNNWDIALPIGLPIGGGSMISLRTSDVIIKLPQLASHGAEQPLWKNDRSLRPTLRGEEVGLAPARADFGLSKDL